MGVYPFANPRASRTYVRHGQSLRSYALRLMIVCTIASRPCLQPCMCVAGRNKSAQCAHIGRYGGYQGGIPLDALFFGLPFLLGAQKEMVTTPRAISAASPRPRSGRETSLRVVYYASVYEVEDQHNVRSPVFGVGIYFFSALVVRRIAAA